MFETYLLADRNSPINVWLRENPMVLSGIFGVIGLVLLYFGIVGLMSGKAKDKYGNELTGGVAMLSSVVRAVAGVGLIGMAIYISIFGAW